MMLFDIVGLDLVVYGTEFILQVYASMSPVIQIVDAGSATSESLANITVRNIIFSMFEAVV